MYKLNYLLLVLCTFYTGCFQSQETEESPKKKSADTIHQVSEKQEIPEKPGVKGTEGIKSFGGSFVSSESGTFCVENFSGEMQNVAKMQCKENSFCKWMDACPSSGKIAGCAHLDSKQVTWFYDKTPLKCQQRVTNNKEVQSLFKSEIINTQVIVENDQPATYVKATLKHDQIEKAQDFNSGDETEITLKKGETYLVTESFPSLTLAVITRDTVFKVKIEKDKVTLDGDVRYSRTKMYASKSMDAYSNSELTVKSCTINEGMLLDGNFSLKYLDNSYELESESFSSKCGTSIVYVHKNFFVQLYLK